MSTGRFAHDARNASLGRTRRSIALCAVALSAFLAACGSDSGSTTGPGNTQKTPDGSYAISTINNGVLPAAIASDTGGYKLEVLSGTITLTTGGQYSFVTNYRQSLTSVGIVDTYTDSSGGAWSMPSGSTTVQFTDGADGSKFQATWVSGQLTLVEQDVSKAQFTVVYKLK